MSENIYVIHKTDYSWNVRNEKGPMEPSSVCPELGWFSDEQEAVELAERLNRNIQREMDKKLEKAREILAFVQEHNRSIAEGQKLKISSFKMMRPVPEPVAPEYDNLRSYAREKRESYHEVVTLRKNDDS